MCKITVKSECVEVCNAVMNKFSDRVHAFSYDVRDNNRANLFFNLYMSCDLYAIDAITAYVKTDVKCVNARQLDLYTSSLVLSCEMKV